MGTRWGIDDEGPTPRLIWVIIVLCFIAVVVVGVWTGWR